MTEIERAISEIVGSNYGECQCHRETMEMAIAALTEQSERSNGCEYCTQGEEMAYGVDTLKRTAHFYLDGNLLTADLYSDSMSVAVCYCPMCGRKLKEDKPQ